MIIEFQGKVAIFVGNDEIFSAHSKYLQITSGSFVNLPLHFKEANRISREENKRNIKIKIVGINSFSKLCQVHVLLLVSREGSDSKYFKPLPFTISPNAELSAIYGLDFNFNLLRQINSSNS